MYEIKTGQTIASDWGSRSHVHTLVLMAVTVGGLYICYLLAKPFIAVLAWALALAILFAPLYRWIESKVKRPNLAATICVLVVGVIVVVPVTFVAARIISEGARGAETIKTMIESGAWHRTVEAHPRMAPVSLWIERQLDLPELVKNATAWLTKEAADFVRGSVMQLIGIALALYILFYFLRDRNAVLKSLRSRSPLTHSDMNRLFSDVGDTVHATLYGTFAVAIVQGTLGGLMFWWLDLPEPLLWGVVMGLLAVIPVLGAFVIWVPAALFLFLSGSAEKALLLTAWGAIVVGGIDNVLYPMFVGERLRMHTVVAFISIVGGLTVFGPAGLILGPVAYTVTRHLLEIWTRRSDEREKDMAE